MKDMNCPKMFLIQIVFKKHYEAISEETRQEKCFYGLKEKLNRTAEEFEIGEYTVYTFANQIDFYGKEKQITFYLYQPCSVELDF